MLGLLNVCHAFVVFHRFRQRCRSRVTDVVFVETARIANEHTQTEVKGSVRQKERMRPRLCCGLWLRVLAYKISFTVLARSPRTASSRFLALAAIVTSSDLLIVYIVISFHLQSVPAGVYCRHW